ncbi:mannose-1-phosphate guanylyltransferase [Pedobacter psychrotolerans]|uniref:mannose-1-phosphate guanylyltransferase n=1 Tax=Pedobacter psychrotolerans TaxID=1843235 RepID=A0A4R2HGR3_9SPHI|nr:mannose-1-phosphate guanylyltransferase [Pedobacter psychrotolerans]TCO26676.1 mannose-1-phosphate guanylyltransferase [Pedobacter psychrotolerans]GGE55649.1 mannose-1-phosphate guanylyltransferase [Pedobacter psychrotolerans]
MKNTNNTFVLIMAGGVGSRFWPKSRNHFPKQFIDILGTGESLLQLTYQRFLKICPNENILILTNAVYADLVKEQLPAVLIDNVLLEPSRNNTAPCIAYATYKILQKNPDANIVVAPSDHLILKEDVFIEKINQALDFTAENDALLTLGISPTRPDTGYGYIEYEVSSSEYQVSSSEYQVSSSEYQESSNGIHKVNAFKEKPVLEKAQEYLNSGNYLWNAGIFIWKAENLQKAFEKYEVEIDTLFKLGNEFYNTPAEAQFILEKYPTSPDISIDYAILEKADNIYTIPADIGWSDLGTWASLHAIAQQDKHQNVCNSEHIHLHDTHDCMINLPKGKAAVIRGLENFIVVDDEQVLLIYPKSEEQEIKGVSKEMVSKFGNQYS